jgi:hypothetical protein
MMPSECSLRKAMDEGAAAAAADTTVGARFRGSMPAARDHGYQDGSLEYEAFSITYRERLAGNDLWLDVDGIVVAFGPAKKH